MDSDTITDLILQYINAQRKYMPITVRSYLRQGSIFSYRYILAEYNSTKIEIKIYNPSFISFNVNSHPKNISCNLMQARDTIDAIFSTAHNS
jgi:hypothetical protein